MMQMRLDAEDAANYAILRASVENVMNQPWSGAFPDLNGDPNAVDTFTVDERTYAIWALMKQHNSKDVTSNWDEITKHILAARKQSKDDNRRTPKKRTVQAVLQLLKKQLQMVKYMQQAVRKMWLLRQEQLLQRL